jgi:hypothetical protein
LLKVRLSASKSVTRYLSDDTVYWVDPEKIIYAMNSEGFSKEVPARSNTLDDDNLYRYGGEGGFSERLERKLEVDPIIYRGRVIDGDWDLQNRKFNELDFYRSYKERASKGTGWEELPYYQRVLWQIKNGTPKWGCRNKQELDERCRKLDNIFNDMKQNGCKSREMQKRELQKGERLEEEDEISVNIGRHGDLIFNNGRHRLTLAKSAGIKEVPITITIRHSEWEKFKEEIELYVQRHNGRLYAPLTHIDLQTIPVHLNQNKYEMIKRSIGDGNTTLLDIGACWGYFCHKFEDDGFICTALECDVESLYFLEKLKRAENKEFSLLKEPISTLFNKGDLQYDVILALDRGRYLSEGVPVFEELIELLNISDTKELYIELSREESNEARDTRYNLSFDEIINHILENSHLNNYIVLGEYEEGKVLYKLYI